MKTKYLFIERLDSGLIFTEDGKKKAFESNTSAMNSLVEAFKDMISKIHSLPTNNMTVKIEVGENHPTFRIEDFIPETQ